MVRERYGDGENDGVGSDETNRVEDGETDGVGSDEKDGIE
jgi:hypothetical protein